MHKQGKVISIAVDNPQIGMQVYAPFYDFFYKKQWGVFTLESIPQSIYMQENGIKSTTCHVSTKQGVLHAGGTDLPTDIPLTDLKQLVVEYTEPNPKWKPPYALLIGGTVTSTITKQLPLKFSQWKTAIDNGEVDSDKIVEFELRPDIGSCSEYAKIIPAKDQGKTYSGLFTSEEIKLITACMESTDNHWGFEPKETELQKSILTKLHQTT